MELWASGFNAFGQLDFEEGEKSILPEDLKTFKCLLKEAHVKLICASISATIGENRLRCCTFKRVISPFVLGSR